MFRDTTLTEKQKVILLKDNPNIDLATLTRKEAGGLIADIFNAIPATDRQIWKLKDLKYTGDFGKLSKQKAGHVIENILSDPGEVPF